VKYLIEESTPVANHITRINLNSLIRKSLFNYFT